jgi:type VI protein secretion system component Hcp
MQKKMFLKLDNVRGDSQSARHVGEIEVTSFMWNMPNHSSGTGGRGRATVSDLVITKQQDRTSALLWVACQTGQPFEKVVLTTEDLSEKGSLIRSIIIGLSAVVMHSMTAREEEETITLNFEGMKLLQS